MNNTTQIGRYELLGPLGAGGMARVSLAHDPHFNRQVAVKMLSENAVHNHSHRQRFDQEARTIANLEHRAIVPVYDFVYDEANLPYLVMRYMKGGSLRRRLTLASPMPLSEAIQLANRIASALDEAHEKRVIHRDIKPANILYDKPGSDGIPFLSDFGILRMEETLSSVTFIGTPAYMAPEQWNRQKISRQTDVYQLAIMLYEALTGQRPFIGTQDQLKHHHLESPVPSICKANPSLPSRCEDVFHQALEKNPEYRFTKPSDFATALAKTLPPQQINHRYQIQEAIKRGGQAEVYRAFDPDLNREVALKMLHKTDLKSPVLMNRFRRDMRILSRLNGDTIVDVYDSGIHEERPFYVMPLMEGQSLKELLERENPLPLDKALGILERIVAALEDAHQQGVIHRDLKPGNVLLDRQGRAFLSDFGIALALNENSDLTRTGEILGSMAYMAPEQFQANHDQQHVYTDVYQLGTLTYELLAGRTPFMGDQFPVMMNQHLNELPPPLSTFVDELPEGLDEVVQKALEKDPAQRYPTVREFFEALIATKEAKEPTIEEVDDPPLPEPVPDPVEAPKRDESVPPASPSASVRRYAMVGTGLLVLTAVLFTILFLNRGLSEEEIIGCLDEAPASFTVLDSDGNETVYDANLDDAMLGTELAIITFRLNSTGVCVPLENQKAVTWSIDGQMMDEASTTLEYRPEDETAILQVDVSIIGESIPAHPFYLLIDHRSEESQ